MHVTIEPTAARDAIESPTMAPFRVEFNTAVKLVGCGAIPWLFSDQQELARMTLYPNDPIS